MPKVSIIVPVYNVERYIDKCIESILQQTFHDFELILVNDGSLDRCGEICDNYAKCDDRIIAIHKENKGIGDTRNVGLKQAQGEYILFVDSDDYIERTLLEKTISIADKNGVDIVIFDIQAVDKNNKLLTNYYIGVVAGHTLKVSEHHELLVTTPSPVNKLYRRSLFIRTKISFPESKVWYEDLRTIPKLLAGSKSIYYYDKTLYYYLYREGSIMHNRNIEKNYFDRTEAMEDLIQYFIASNIYDQFYSELEAICTFQCYFYPCREIISSDSKSPYLLRFRKNLERVFPDFYKNSYVSRLTQKEKLIFFLLYHKQYKLINFGNKILTLWKEWKNGKNFDGSDSCL